MPIIDADEYDGQIVIVSEYAPDGSLEEWLKANGAMPVERAIETTIQILGGLEFLHSRNIIHRDLKPANILLQGKTPRLADFGISRALRTTVASQSQNISGTFAYMLPEALDGKRSVQTDVWSVGVSFYQFLTGTLPFPQKEPPVLFPAIIMRAFAPLPDPIPQSLQNVIAKALAKLPENRYKTASEMREDLRRVLRGEAVFDFVKSNPRQKLSVKQIPPTQKVILVSAQNSQDEMATVVRPSFHFQPRVQITKSKKSIWGYAIFYCLFIAVCLASFAFYVLVNDSSQNSIEKLTEEKTGKNSNNSNNTTISTPKEIVGLNGSSINLKNENTVGSKQNELETQQTINSFIRGIENAVGSEKETRKIVYGDIDGDKDSDMIVQTSFQYNDSTEAKVETIILFIKNKEMYTGTVYKSVGGTYLGKFNLEKIADKKIYGVFTYCKESLRVEQCIKEKKSENKQLQFFYENGEIVEKLIR